jgi:hypothetical protein
LQLKHNHSQVFRFNLVTRISLADIVVLAKPALEIASSKENSARTAPTAQGVFFTQMGAIAAYFGPFAGTANAYLPGTTVNPAMPGTNVADRQVLVCPGDARPEFATAQELQVGWFQ